MIIGTNWFRGFSHTTAAKDRFIKSYQNSANISAIMKVFVDAGIESLENFSGNFTYQSQ